MLLGYFTEDAYENLLDNISQNSEYYSGEDDWLPKYFGGEDNYFKNSTVNVNRYTPAYNPGKKDDSQKASEDLVNTRNLYDAFKNLTPLQASNKYMWTYLCHAIPEYNAYIRDRWMQEERENTIRNRFFVTTPGSLLNDNALSRLWWYGHLTYDSTNSNHYALTEILLTNQTICTDVMDTFNRMNYDRMRGVLLAIKDFKDEITNNEGITDYFRECKKYLNHYAAVTTLEYLESEEIRDIAFNYMMKLREEKNKK
ncbi:MAG: hypothetical protein E7Z89_07500 [Cyanobacteria bacterium SIG28]|nr:hypothetical protein [Cyanobacteria bacterium SIG28]